MSARFHNADWGEDRRGLSNDPSILPRLAEMLDVPTPPQSTWRAAIVTLFATNPLGVTSIYLQHVQDIAWRISEETLINNAIPLLVHRANGTTPPSG